MKYNLLFMLLISFLLISCSQNEKPDEKIIGKWGMERVYEYDKDVTFRHNPKKNRWIKFAADGTFVSDGDPFGKNTGRWRMDSNETILYIDSDVDDDDSEWKIIFENDEMIWTGIGHPRKENTKLVHKKME